MKPIIPLLSLLLSAVVPLFAQQTASPNNASEVVLFPSDDPSAATGTGAIVFSNLDSGGGYNSDQFAAKAVAGREAGGGQDERWDAVRFIPKVDVRVQTLSAAIGYISGTRLVNLALYSDDAFFITPKDPLPGGSGSTRDIPDVGECCQLATVTLAGDGVLLEAGVPYWLVATPDDTLGPTFSGKWHVSNFGSHASIGPPSPWFPASGAWLAAEIRGTRAQANGSAAPENAHVFSSSASAPRGKVTIFTNLDSTLVKSYTVGIGALISGNDVPFNPEVWEALPFTPKAAVHARTLAAAIAWVSGTNKVNLGVYTDNGGVPGTPLPGGQGATTEIPDSGECCDLATVRLSGAGVALNAGVTYWLVASPDDINAPDFHGIWQPTFSAVSAYEQPEFFGWIAFTGGWLGAEIRGTRD